MRILHWYILKQHLVPFLLGFGVVTFILEMDVLFDYLDLIVNRGVAVGIVAQLFLLSLGYIIALSVPCAVLVAVLMTFGRLSQDNEITALRAGGINLAGVLVGPLVAAALVGTGLTLFNNYVLPESNHQFANLLIDIGRMRPTVKLQEGVFVTDFPGYNLLVRSVNGRTNQMRGVTLYQNNPGGTPTTILATSGYLTYTPDGRTAVLELSDGEIHEIPPGEEGVRTYRRLEFKKHVIYIANAGGILERSVRETRSDREMSAAMLLAQRDSLLHEFGEQRDYHHRRLVNLGATERQLEAARGGLGWTELLGGIARALRFERAESERAGPGGLADTQLDVWRVQRRAMQKRIAALSVEIHKKFSLPTACLVFVLVGAPIGMRVRRAGPAVAFVSIVFFLFYYLCLVGGEELANRLLAPAWLSMWLPNIMLGAWGLDMTLRACELRRPRRRPRPRAAAA